jgi:hypothetical protein
MTESAKPEAAKTEWTPVSLLEDIKEHGRVWEDLANQYGVTNPDPPWKTSLDGMCEALGTTSCSPAMALEKRWLEGSIDRDASVAPSRCLCWSGAGKRMNCPRLSIRTSPSPSDSFWP